MLFYKICAYYETPNQENESEFAEHLRNRRNNRHKMQKLLDDMNRELTGHAFYCISERDDDDGKLTAAVITETAKLMQTHLSEFFNVLGVPSDDVIVEEITLKELAGLLSTSSRHNYIESDDEVLEKFNLTNVYDEYRREFDFAENLIPKAEKPEVMKFAEKSMYAETLVAEMNRIFAPVSQKALNWGNPAHYMLLHVDDGDTRKDTYRAILSALYAAGRLQSKRYWYVDASPTERMSKKGFDCLYSNSRGGTVIIRYTPIDDAEENNHASANRRLVETLCDVMKKYQNDVLTVLCIPADYQNVRQMFYEYLGSLNIVEIKEERAGGEKAKQYLRRLAKDKALQTDKALYARVEDGKKYRADELEEQFQEWWHAKLRKTIYPAYRDMQKAEAIAIQMKSRGSAYDELRKMIGLKEAKKVIDDAINYFRAQRIFKDKGFQNDRPVMNIVFTGAPGSAKTTVARLFAEILKEEGILETGNFVECGRGDLVGRYVGWTAPTIQKKFREAKGGVLFIDEAYSLVDDCDGSFGDEAISTIVQEMENHRSEVMVIFAGYPDKMEQFLNKNPGLRSRIAFHVPFADYDTNELVEIAELMAEKKNLILAPETVEKMRGIFDEIRTQHDFGNGRAVRNVLEAAKMAMSSRLLRADFDKLSETDVKTVLPEDVSTPVLTAVPATPRRAIGF